MPDGPSSPARGEFTGEPKKYSNALDEAESGLALKMFFSCPLNAHNVHVGFNQFN